MKLAHNKNIGRVAIAAVLATSLCFTTVGCTDADVQKSVALIQAELPTAIQLALEVAQIVAVFGATEPQNGVSNTSATIQSSLKELQALCASYTANPNATTYASILNVIDALVTTGDQELLDATHITNPDSRQKATAVIGSLDVVLHIIDGYIQATQSTKQVRANAARRTVKLAQVEPYWPAGEGRRVARYTVVAERYGF